MYLPIGLFTIALASLVQVNGIPLTEGTMGYILPNGTELHEVFDPRPHGESPVYSRSRWPRTIFVQRDKTPTECTEFPDNYGISVEYLFSQDNYTVYCWENTTMYDPSGVLFLRTIQDCYVNENDLKAEDIDFASRLPNCGPVKPYLVQNSPLLWNTTWEDTAHYTLPCWREPTTKSQRIETAATGFHLYCWVEGEKYGNSTQWWESARLEDYKKCYFPAEMFYEGLNATSGIFGKMPGSGGRCQS